MIPVAPNRLLLALIIGGGMLFILTSSLEANEWEWSLKPNDQFDVTLNHSTVSDSTFGEQKISQTNRYQVAMTWTVKSVDASQVATIEKTIHSIHFSVESNAPFPFKVTVDTTGNTASGKTISGTEGATLLKHMQSLVGKTLQMTMKPNGQTETLPVPPETQAALDAFPKTDYAFQLFDVNSASETAYFVFLPAKKLAPGETWQRESEVGVHENEAFTTTFKYVGETEKEGISLDAFAITVSPKKAGDRQVAPGAEQPATVSKQLGSGSCFFDRQSKHFASSEYRNEVSFSTAAQKSVVTSNFKTSIIRK